jgi:hypothetical protein
MVPNGERSVFYSRAQNKLPGTAEYRHHYLLLVWQLQSIVEISPYEASGAYMVEHFYHVLSSYVRLALRRHYH